MLFHEHQWLIEVIDILESLNVIDDLWTHRIEGFAFPLLASANVLQQLFISGVGFFNHIPTVIELFDYRYHMPLVLLRYF